jgi:hypothetical protein
VLQLVDGAGHGLARGADHVPDQRVADREVDPDSVADDAAVALREVQELAPHPFDVPCVGEVAERILLLRKGDLEQLDERLAGRGHLAQLIPRCSSDPYQARLDQAQQQFIGGRRKQHLPRPALASDDGTRTAAGRAANNHEALFDREKLGLEKRPAEMRVARAERKGRTASEDLRGALGGRMRVAEQAQPPPLAECAPLHYLLVSRRRVILTRREWAGRALRPGPTVMIIARGRGSPALRREPTRRVGGR